MTGRGDSVRELISPTPTCFSSWTFLSLITRLIEPMMLLSRYRANGTIPRSQPDTAQTHTTSIMKIFSVTLSAFFALSACTGFVLDSNSFAGNNPYYAASFSAFFRWVFFSSIIYRYLSRFWCAQCYAMRGNDGVTSLDWKTILWGGRPLIASQALISEPSTQGPSPLSMIWN